MSREEIAYWTEEVDFDLDYPPWQNLSAFLVDLVVGEQTEWTHAPASEPEDEDSIKVYRAYNASSGDVKASTRLVSLMSDDHSGELSAPGEVGSASRRLWERGRPHKRERVLQHTFTFGGTPCGAANRYCPVGSSTYTPVDGGHYGSAPHIPGRLDVFEMQSPCPNGFTCDDGIMTLSPPGFSSVARLRFIERTTCQAQRFCDYGSFSGNGFGVHNSRVIVHTYTKKSASVGCFSHSDWPRGIQIKALTPVKISGFSNGMPSNGLSDAATAGINRGTESNVLASPAPTRTSFCLQWPGYCHGGSACFAASKQASASACGSECTWTSGAPGIVNQIVACTHSRCAASIGAAAFTEACVHYNKDGKVFAHDWIESPKGQRCVDHNGNFGGTMSVGLGHESVQACKVTCNSNPKCTGFTWHDGTTWYPDEATTLSNPSWNPVFFSGGCTYMCSSLIAGDYGICGAQNTAARPHVNAGSTTCAGGTKASANAKCFSKPCDSTTIPSRGDCSYFCPASTFNSYKPRHQMGTPPTAQGEYDLPACSLYLTESRCINPLNLGQCIWVHSGDGAVAPTAGPVRMSGTSIIPCAGTGSVIAIPVGQTISQVTAADGWAIRHGNGNSGNFPCTFGAFGFPTTALIDCYCLTHGTAHSRCTNQHDKPLRIFGAEYYSGPVDATSTCSTRRLRLPCPDDRLCTAGLQGDRLEFTAKKVSITKFWLRDVSGMYERKKLTVQYSRVRGVSNPGFVVGDPVDIVGTGWGSVDGRWIVDRAEHSASDIAAWSTVTVGTYYLDLRRGPDKGNSWTFPPNAIGHPTAKFEKTEHLEEDVETGCPESSSGCFVHIVNDRGQLPACTDGRSNQQLSFRWMRESRTPVTDYASGIQLDIRDYKCDATDNCKWGGLSFPAGRDGLILPKDKISIEDQFCVSGFGEDFEDYNGGTGNLFEVFDNFGSDPSKPEDERRNWIGTSDFMLYDLDSEFTPTNTDTDGNPGTKVSARARAVV